VETGLDAQSEIEQLVADIECAADREGGAVEDGGLEPRFPTPSG
jgi:hypothetical protein